MISATPDMTSFSDSVDQPPDMERRFGSLARLYGVPGAARIRQSHIVVVGLGGVGSWAAEAAARSGVAQLTLIDLDHIAESNINRQAHALDTTLGQAKVVAMRERIALINPLCKVNVIEEFVDADNWPRIAGLDSVFDPVLTGVIDACDQGRAKAAMAVWAIRAQALFISVGAAGGKRLAHKVDIDDLSAVTHDPLLAQLRNRIRKATGVSSGKKIGVSCVFSREAVVRPSATSATDSSLNCHGYGSTVSVTSTFGVCAAGWLINNIAESS